MTLMVAFLGYAILGAIVQFCNHMLFRQFEERVKKLEQDVKILKDLQGLQ